MNHLHEKLNITAPTDDITFNDIYELQKLTPIQEITDEKLLLKYMLQKIMSQCVDSRKLPIIDLTNKIKFHPMDIFLYLFLKCESSFRKIFVDKITQCQLATPLLINDSQTITLVNYTETYDSMIKYYKPNPGDAQRHFSVTNEKIHFVSFIRFGNRNNSEKYTKSSILNCMLEFPHPCFFDLNCIGFRNERHIFNGTVEMLIYLPLPQNSSFENCLYNEPVNLLNLRGDAFQCPNQVKLLFEKSSLVCIFVSRNTITTDELGKLHEYMKIYNNKICLVFTSYDENGDDEKWIMDEFEYSETNTLQFEQDIEFHSHELKSMIKNRLLCTKIQKLSLNEFTKFENLFSSNSTQIQPLKTNFINNIFTEDFLQKKFPLQSNCWTEIALNERKLYKLDKDKSPIEYFKVYDSINTIKKKQKEIFSAANYSMIEYSDLLMDDCHIFQRWTSLQNELNKLILCNDNLQETEKHLFCRNLNIQTFIREFGQMFEIVNYLHCGSLNSDITNLHGFNVSSIPKIIAKILLTGHPFEIFDGNENHIPIEFVRNVLTALSNEIGPSHRIYVLGILGAQSSGKSTLLNSMFGLQFPVSVGACTRGINLHVVPISTSLKLEYDYLVILDTEGFTDQLKIVKMNEMAILVICLSDLTLVNLKGEDQSSFQPIFQTILCASDELTEFWDRNLKPKLYFVNQNVENVEAKTNLKDQYKTYFDNLNISTNTRLTDKIEFDYDTNIFFISGYYCRQPPMSIISHFYVDDVQKLKISIIDRMEQTENSSMTILDWRNKLTRLWNCLLQKTILCLGADGINEIHCKYELEDALFKSRANFNFQIVEYTSELENEISTAHPGNHCLDFYRRTIEEKCELLLSNEIAEFESNYSTSESGLKAKFKECMRGTCDIHLKQLNEKLIFSFKKAELQQKYEKKCENHLKQFEEHVYAELFIGQSFESAFEQFWNGMVNSIDEPVEMPLDFTTKLNKSIEKNLANYLIGNEELRIIQNFVGDGNQYCSLKGELLRSFVVCGKHIKFPEFDSYYKLNYESWLHFLGKDRETVGNLKFKIINDLDIQFEVQKLVASIDNRIKSYLDTISCPSIDNIATYFDNIINVILLGTNEFNRNLNTQNFSHKFEITNLFMYEVSLFYCYKSIEKFAEFREKIKNDFKKQLKDIFSLIYVEKSIPENLNFAKIVAETLYSKIEAFLKEKFHNIIYIYLHCDYLTDSKFNLQLKILLDLAERNRFDQYILYINDPYEYIKTWLQEKALRYLDTNNQHNKLTELNKIFKDAYYACIDLSVRGLRSALSTTNRGQTNSDWKNKFFDHCRGFTRNFKRSDLRLIKKDLNTNNNKKFIHFFEVYLLEKVFSITSWTTNYELSNEEFRNMFQNCRVCCKYCNQPCLSSHINTSKHESRTCHRPLGIYGWKYRETGEFIGSTCANTDLINENNTAITHQELNFAFAKNFMKEWDICRSEAYFEINYWQWVFYIFRNEFAQYYNYQLNIPAIEMWSNLSKNQILCQLRQFIDCFAKPTISDKIQRRIFSILPCKNPL